MKGCVSTISGSRVFNKASQKWCIPQHRGKSVFRPCLRHVESRLHNEDRTRVLADMESNNIIENLSLANLGRGHHDHSLDAWVRHRIHDATLVLGSASIPRAGFSRCLWGEPAILVSPLAHCQARWWLQHLPHRLLERLAQLLRLYLLLGFRPIHLVPQ